MRNSKPIIVTLFLGCGLFLVLGACAGGAKVLEPTPPKVSAAPVAPDVPFPDFRGERKVPGAWFDMQNNPVVVNALKTKVSLHRLEWISVEGPDGKDVREGTAIIIVERNGADKMLHLDEGESKTALGVRVTVKTVQEIYDKERLDFRPRITLKVE